MPNSSTSDDPEWVDENFDVESGEDSGDEGSGSSVSSFSESEMPDKSFDPMPVRLTLPIELHRLVLSWETSQYQIMWRTYRLVCKAWKEQVEFLAKTEWILYSGFNYPGYMILQQYDSDGKVFLNGDFTFQRMEGDTAIFQTDCAAEYKKELVRACKATAPPDVEVCEMVHDVEISGMVVDWDTLTISCPWRPLIGRVVAEELRVAAYRARSHKVLMTAAKRMRRRCGGDVDLDGFQTMLTMFAEHWQAAYVAVRLERRGRADKRGDERLKHARQAASIRMMWGGEEEKEREEDDAAESGSEESDGSH
ncbi:hypothetical protein B0H10DRAFT_1413968 [Mycena sp. CBHHK59/15]|nr:hypothetical protein B0H10DRAFT_1413968 [Mycena sp. CBHHK59/15]